MPGKQAKQIRKVLRRRPMCRLSRLRRPPDASPRLGGSCCLWYNGHMKASIALLLGWFRREDALSAFFAPSDTNMRSYDRKFILGFRQPFFPTDAGGADSKPRAS